jgi:vacuolar-type H+-ATPase subunit I/STV1
MKKLIINPTEKEKILSQYNGTLKVNTQNFNKLVESTLGNVKPITEQEVETPPQPLPNEQELAQKEMELMTQMQAIQSGKEKLRKAQEEKEKISQLEFLTDRLNQVETYIKDTCKGRRFFHGALCRKYFKESEKLNNKLLELNKLAGENSGGEGGSQYKSGDSGEGEGKHQFVMNWTSALSTVLTLLGSIAAFKWKSDNESNTP